LSRIKPVRLLLFFAALVLVTGCATATPYQPAADRYGYFDQQIEKDHYLVGFAGNSVTSRQTVETYLLYHAAQLTLATGHDWFVITDRNTDASTRYAGWVDSYPGFGFGPGWYGPGGAGFGGFGFGIGLGSMSAYPITRYTAQATIVVFSGEKPEDNVNAYDARDVIERLQPSVVFPVEDG
jgi:hypothetical protein